MSVYLSVHLSDHLSVCMSVEISVILYTRYTKFGMKVPEYYTQIKCISNIRYHAHRSHKSRLLSKLVKS